MASPSFANYLVTQEQFNTFHNIDRLLFTWLVHSLGRDPRESMQVIALWIWLEQVGQCRYLVANMLKWPATLITSLADEAVLLLTCIESNEKTIDDVHVPLTQRMTKDGVSLKYFHENRLAIIHGVTRNINDVCSKAFVDVLPNVLLPTVNDIAVQRSLLRSDEMVEMLRRLAISSNSDEQEMNKEEVVPQDERTIFLTFSKGYPISKNEIKDFFTRNFGECIETICMQEAAAVEQPLYARLVVYSASVMEVVLDGQSKAKFSINGKHVWARKFVRRNHKSPPRS
ncbi:uncharacterized protein LOC116111881 [Pistacia vera]|uniref:uncharacterized protein LOC116111881 n=1 Tax=Pistacia vera TaxID=55513 RepID=UPI0012636A27|nr:uncharacterized protein LOC116111881 [Pistacia vera]